MQIVQIEQTSWIEKTYITNTTNIGQTKSTTKTSNIKNSIYSISNAGKTNEIEITFTKNRNSETNETNTY